MGSHVRFSFVIVPEKRTYDFPIAIAIAIASPCSQSCVLKKNGGLLEAIACRLPMANGKGALLRFPNCHFKIHFEKGKLRLRHIWKGNRSF